MKLRENLPMGVMKPYEVHDAIYFRVQCDCMGEDHDLTIYSEEEHGSGINFSYKSYIPITNSSITKWEWLKNFWTRITTATRIIVYGYIETDNEFFLGKQNIEGLLQALKELSEKELNRKVTITIED